MIQSPVSTLKTTLETPVTPIEAPKPESPVMGEPELVDSLTKISANLDKITDKLTKEKVEKSTTPYFKYFAAIAGTVAFAATMYEYPNMLPELFWDAKNVAKTTVQIANEVPSVINTVKEVGEATYALTTVVGTPIGAIRNVMSNALDLDIPQVTTEAELSGLGITFISKATIIKTALDFAGWMMSPVGELIKPVVGENRVNFVSTALKTGGFVYSVITSALPVPISEVGEAAANFARGLTMRLLSSI